MTDIIWYLYQVLLRLTRPPLRVCLSSSSSPIFLAPTALAVRDPAATCETIQKPFFVGATVTHLESRRLEYNSSQQYVGSLSNHDDDGNKNPTNLYIWQWKTVFLHALHVHFSFFDILKTFSFFLRREMTCFAVVWTTSAYDNKCSILSSYAPSVCSNLIPGQLEHIS